MILDKKSWEEFRATGLLWLVNTTLHVFGWAIVVDVEEETEKVVRAYPARVKCRGFHEADNTAGYSMIARYLKDTAAEIEEEAR